MRRPLRNPSTANTAAAAKAAAAAADITATVPTVVAARLGPGGQQWAAELAITDADAATTAGRGRLDTRRCAIQPYTHIGYALQATRAEAAAAGHLCANGTVRPDLAAHYYDQIFVPRLARAINHLADRAKDSRPARLNPLPTAATGHDPTPKAGTGTPSRRVRRLDGDDVPDPAEAVANADAARALLDPLSDDLSPALRSYLEALRARTELADAFGDHGAGAWLADELGLKRNNARQLAKRLSEATRPAWDRTDPDDRPDVA